MILSNINPGQYIPATSMMHALDPRTKILFTAISMISVFMADNLYQLEYLLVGCIITVLISRINFLIYLKGLKPFLIIIIITALLQILLNKNHVTGLYNAGTISLRIIIILIWAEMLSFTTTPMTLTGGLEKILKPLSRVGFPTQEIVMIMTITLRFIPLFLQEADRISRAQKSRGADFNSHNLNQRLRNLVSLLVPMFLIAFKRANDLAHAMESRGYTADNRTSLYELSMDNRDYLFLAATAGWLIIFMLLKYF